MFLRNTVLILPELHPAQQGLKQFHSERHILAHCLPELHPAQQGLKPRIREKYQDDITLPELHPAQQGLKQTHLTKDGYERVSSRTTSSTTRIETKPAWNKWKWPIPLPELHPAQQGLKPFNLR